MEKTQDLETQAHNFSPFFSSFSVFENAVISVLEFETTVEPQEIYARITDVFETLLTEFIQKHNIDLDDALQPSEDCEMYEEVDNEPQIPDPPVTPVQPKKQLGQTFLPEETRDFPLRSLAPVNRKERKSVEVPFFEDPYHQHTCKECDSPELPRHHSLCYTCFRAYNY